MEFKGKFIYFANSTDEDMFLMCEEPYYYGAPIISIPFDKINDFIQDLTDLKEFLKTNDKENK